MLLSAPIYKLKRRAKRLAREDGLALHQALDRIAKEEGFPRWSLLAAQMAQTGPGAAVLARLTPGSLALLAARPSHGKTLLGLEIAAEARRIGRKGFFFTLDFNERDVADRLVELGLDERLVEVDASDGINADYIIDRVAQVGGDAVVVIDYLQLLDQRRADPSLQAQVDALRGFAKSQGAVILFISQVDRAFEGAGKTMPEISDLRLPNPLDLSAFDMACFLHDGEIRLEAAA